MEKKKSYQKPMFSTVEVDLNMPVAWSPIGYDNDPANPFGEVLSPERRGSWGDLWKE